MTKNKNNTCHCDREVPFSECCEPYLLGSQVAPDPVSLMRSRYSAFVTMNESYLQATWHEAFRPAELGLDPNQRWLGLKVRSHFMKGDHGEVDFVARYKIQGKAYRLEEHSLFSRIDGRWYYLHPIDQKDH